MYCNKFHQMPRNETINFLKVLLYHRKTVVLVTTLFANVYKVRLTVSRVK